MRDMGGWFRRFVVWCVVVSAACGNSAATQPAGNGGLDAGVPDASMPDAPPPQVTLARIEVTPSQPRVPNGTMRALTATGVFSDATTRDVTSQVAWTSDTAAHATVSSAGVVLGVAPGTATITATLDSVSGSTTVTVTDAVLTAIAVGPVGSSVPLGLTQQLTATGTFSDATTLDLTDQASWSSGAPNLATVASTGLVATHATGTVTIMATLGAVTGETQLTVTSAVLASLAVTPTDPSVPAGRTQPLIATGTFSDATTMDLTSQVTWASDHEASATISNADGSRGLVTARVVGTARITATLDTITGATTLQVTDAVLVSLAVTPVDPTLPAGLSLQLTATGTFSDASMMNVTDQVIWASSSTDVAQVSNAAGSHGLVTTSQLLGGADITATLAGATGGTHLTVTDAVLQSIAVTPADPSVPLGRTQALIAMGTFSDASMRDVTRDATWTSSQPGIASVSDAVDTRGLATALALGTTSITAALTGKTGATMLTVTDPVVTSIDVTPGAAGVSAGRTQAYKATGTFSDRTMHDITDQVTWASQQPAIAQISNAADSRGVATGLSPGIATITATLDGHTGLASLTVLDAALDSIAVTPATPSVPAGLTQAFTATGTFSDKTIRDLTGQVTWASSVPSVAQISNATGSRGVATGVASGTATITAKLGQVSGTATLTVTNALLVSLAVGPVAPSVPLGRAQPFTATGTFTDASVRDVTGDASWASSDPTVAPISNTAGSRGVATAQVLGTTQISATLSGMTAATTMTVTAPVVASIAVAPGRAAIGVNSTQAFTATGTFTDGTMHDLTGQVTWASSEPAAAQVSNTAGSQGVATALAAGTPRITATLAGVTGSAVLSVIDFQRIDFLYGYCDPLTPEAGVTVTGLEFALDRGFDPERFSSVRWLDPAGQAFSIDAPVSELDGSFDGLRCLPASEFLRRVMFGDRLTLLFIGSTTTVTVTFRADFLTPQSAFSLDQLGVQFVP